MRPSFSVRLRVTEGYGGQVEEWLAACRIDLGLFNRYGRGAVRVAEAGLATLMPAHLARREYPADTFTTARVVRPVLHQKTWLAFTTQRPAGLAARTVGRLVREMAAGLA